MDSQLSLFSNAETEFERRRRDRIARFVALKEKYEGICTASELVAREELERIPPGQPILIGNYSVRQKRDGLKRIEAYFRTADGAKEKAEYYARRARAAAENQAIFSDDPEVLEKVTDKLARLKKRHNLMRNANRLVRRENQEGLAELGFSEAQIQKLLTPDLAGRLGFPDYVIAKNSANIRRIKQRLRTLQKSRTEEVGETVTGNGVRIVDNVKANRLQLFFPACPSREIRAELKSNGFRWAKTFCVWQRHRGEAARAAVRALFGVTI
jgi:Domain of unknown function (DUF3560)